MTNYEESMPICISQSPTINRSHTTHNHESIKKEIEYDILKLQYFIDNIKKVIVSVSCYIK